jgi:hypothetical protein
MVLALMLCFGLICGVIANNKGENFLVWFVFGALLFIVALPMVLLLKPATIETTPGAANKHCPHCRSIIPTPATVCRYCTRSLT